MAQKIVPSAVVSGPGVTKRSGFHVSFIKQSAPTIQNSFGLVIIDPLQRGNQALFSPARP